MTNDTNTRPTSGGVHPLYAAAIGGVLAGVELFPIGHACDRIKTLQQAFPKDKATVLQTARSIFQRFGISGFYTGFRWNCITHCGKASFRWTMMSTMETLFQKIIPPRLKEQHTSLQPLCLGISVSLCETFLLICPAESLKTKEMTRAIGNKKIKWIPYVKEIGFRRLYDGWDSVLLRQFVSWSSFLLAYEKARSLALKFSSNPKLNTLEQLGVGATAGAINVLCTTPIDTIKTHLQKDIPLSHKYIFKAIPEFIQNYGIKSLYSGLSIRMIRSSWYAAITLLMMEKVGMFRSHHA